jgi:cholesterol transport system auxiliary component
MTNARFTPADRRLFLIGASSLALTACGNLLGTPPPSQIYVLRPAPPPLQPGSKVPWALAVMKPNALEALDTERIALARNDTQLDYYANAVWPDRLPNIVQTALVAGFEASGRIDSVARDEDALRADYDLSTEIRDFEARYTTPDGAPTVAVTIIGHMAGAHSREIVANLTANFTQPASANSVDAVVQAFDVALTSATAQIVSWALTLPPPPQRATAADIRTPSTRTPASTAARARAPVSPRQAPGGNEIPVPGSATPPAP